jgi:hypothetical protein
MEEGAPQKSCENSTSVFRISNQCRKVPPGRICPFTSGDFYRIAASPLLLLSLWLWMFIVMDVSSIFSSLNFCTKKPFLVPEEKCFCHFPHLFLPSGLWFRSVVLVADNLWATCLAHIWVHSFLGLRVAGQHWNFWFFLFGVCVCVYLRHDTIKGEHGRKQYVCNTDDCWGYPCIESQG